MMSASSNKRPMCVTIETRQALALAKIARWRGGAKSSSSSSMGNATPGAALPGFNSPGFIVGGAGREDRAAGGFAGWLVALGAPLPGSCGGPDAGRLGFKLAPKAESGAESLVAMELSRPKVGWDKPTRKAQHKSGREARLHHYTDIRAEGSTLFPEKWPRAKNGGKCRFG